MTIPIIPVFTGTSPDRNTQSAAAFTINSIEWLDYQLIQIDATNVSIEGINDTATQVTADALTATNAAAASASSANFKGEWSTLAGALNIPASVSNNGTVWQLITNLADVTTSEPGVTADWIPLNVEIWQPPKTANFSVLASVNYLIDGSSGTVDGALPTSGVVGTPIVANNSVDSANLVRLTNASLTIKGPDGTIAAGDNVVLNPGDTFHFVFTTPTTLGAV